MNKKTNLRGFVSPEVTGGPYAYRCLACRHRFIRAFSVNDRK